MKYRIVYNDKNNKYYIEEKFLFFWTTCRYMASSSCDIEFEFKTKEEAETLIKYWLKKPKIIIVGEYSDDQR